MKKNNNSISLFGHSMGGAVVIELARKLVEAEFNLENIIVSGLLPPHVRRGDYEFVKYSDEEFIEYMLLTDRKSTRLNSSHVAISYAVFCLKKKTKINIMT